VTFALFGGIVFFQSQKPLLQHSLLVGLITLFFITLLLRIFKKIQCVQNYLARVVAWFSHSVPLLKSLHWLPVQSRIIFKLCTITYQTLSSGEPSYLFSMLSLAPKPKELRSSGFHLLSVPRVKTHAGVRTFSVAVPTLWNSLSEHIKSSNSIVSFRHYLKTDLFRPAYSS